ncbi:hypothetical protein [Ensifer canadensis]|jgi:hypothetical protein
MQQFKVLQHCASYWTHSAAGAQKGDFAMMDAAFVKMTTLAIVLVSCVIMVQPY